MVYWLKISTISDVITNSSTEVYVMNEEDGLYYKEHIKDYELLGCTHVRPIGWDEVLSRDGTGNELYAPDFVCGILQTSIPDLGNYYKDPIAYMRKWLDWCEAHRAEIEEQVIDKYLVCIEAHGREEWLDKAAEKALWGKRYD